jgi:hypothetical protein
VDFAGNPERGQCGFWRASLLVCVVAFGLRFASYKEGKVFGGTPNTASGTLALPKRWQSSQGFCGFVGSMFFSE